MVKLNSYGYVEAGESCLPDAEVGADTRGIFVAGDCRTKAIRQVTTATADGAVSALAACRFIDGM
jgi:thioredoxin reductase (NADPH)